MLRPGSSSHSSVEPSSLASPIPDISSNRFLGAWNWTDGPGSLILALATCGGRGDGRGGVAGVYRHRANAEASRRQGQREETATAHSRVRAAGLAAAG